MITEAKQTQCVQEAVLCTHDTGALELPYLSYHTLEITILTITGHDPPSLDMIHTITAYG